LVEAPGNVLIPAKAAGLPKDSVANVSQIITIDRDFLTEPGWQAARPTTEDD
jgi:mRNA interferase MazF